MKKLTYLLSIVLCLHLSVQAQSIIYTIAGSSSIGYSGDGDIATAAELDGPNGIALDNSGNKYIADYGNNRIRKVSAAGIITTIAGIGGSYAYSGDGGPAIAAELGGPAGIALDISGNIYISDFNTHRIRKINTSGIITTIAGNGMAGYIGDGGPAASAELHGPIGLAIDSVGNVYIADNVNNCIRKINTSGIITTIAGTGGTSGYSGDGGPATSALLHSPTGVTVDGRGNVYIADDVNSCIRMVNLSGIITTIAGTGTVGFSGDGGSATLAQLDHPAYIALDSSGNIFLSDNGNSRVRKINTTGIITTIAGNGVPGYSGDGGPSIAAKLYSPDGLAVDDSGNVYIADADNARIRLVSSNHTPHFITGAAQSDTACAGMAFSLDTALAIIDSDFGQTETWTLATAPLYGTAIVAYTDTSDGDTLVPTGLTYTPAAGYTGTDSFTVIVSDRLTSAYTTIYVTVFPPPAAGAITGADTLCTGHTITLADTAAGGTWHASTGSIATVSSAGVVTPISSGRDTISYTVTTACASARAIKVITIGAAPSATITSAPFATCVRMSDSLAASPAGGTWSAAAPTVGFVTSGGIFIAAAPGVDTIRYTVASAGCGTAIAVQVDTVLAAPLPPAITGSDTLCMGAADTLTGSTAGGTWTSHHDSIATISASGIVTALAAGNDTLTYTLTNICGSSRATKAIHIYTAAECDSFLSITPLSAYANADGLHVYPNPSNGLFVVEVPAAAVPAAVMLTDIYGKTIQAKAIAPNAGSIPFDISNMARGTYFIKVSVGDRTYRDKVVVW